MVRSGCQNFVDLTKSGSVRESNWLHIARQPIALPPCQPCNRIGLLVGSAASSHLRTLLTMKSPSSQLTLWIT
uniref:SFRICE_032064 n=1 Tax=Spodoptera frugiperda TaxID=7108 RepID=A0A2H1VKL1_SPOFR